MRILFLIHEYPPVGGGAGVALFHMATAMHRAGHQIAVLSCGRQTDIRDQADFIIRRILISTAGGALSGLRDWMTFLRYAPRELKKMAEEFKPDVINAHFAFPAGWVAARAELPCPLVTSIIGADIHDPTRRVSADRNSLVFRAVKKALSRSQAVTADSRDLAQRTHALYPFIQPTVVHFGVPPLQPTSRSRETLGIPEGHLAIVTLCRLVSRKRLDILIEAAASLPDAPLHITILGDGPLRRSLEHQTRVQGLEQRIQFKGNVSEEEKTEYLTHADLFCLPSEHEGFGLVFLEAMSLGTPVLTTACGGQTDLIQNDLNGLLIDRPDAQLLARELDRICRDPAILDRLGAAAGKTAGAFTPEATAAGFLEVFTSVLTARPPSA